MTKEGENVVENEKVRQKTRRGEDERNKVESLRENTTKDSQSYPRPACHQVPLLLPCSTAVESSQWRVFWLLSPRLGQLHAG